MKNKFLVFAFAVIFFLSAIWLSGVYLMSVLASKGVDNAIAYCNEILYSRYKSGTFLYKTSLRYKAKSHSLFSQRGFLEVSFQGLPNTYDIPVEINHGFLTIDAHFDFYRVLNRLLIENEVLEKNSKADGTLRIRLFPYTTTFVANVEGPYNKDLVMHGIIDEKFNFDDTKLKATMMLSHSNFGNDLEAFEVRHLYIPGVSAEKLYLMSTFEIKDGIQIPKSARYDVQGLKRSGELLSQFKSLDIRLDATDLDYDRNFKLNTFIAASTQEGVLAVRGDIGKFNVDVMKAKDTSFTELLLNYKHLTNYTTQKNLYLNVEELIFNALSENSPGQMLYEGKAKGSARISASKKDLFDSLEGVSGKFTVEFSKFNEFGRDFIRNLGGTMLYEDDERFATEMTIEQGKIIFNGHVF